MAFTAHHYSTKAPREPRMPHIRGGHAPTLHIAPLRLSGGHIGGHRR